MRFLPREIILALTLSGCKFLNTETAPSGEPEAAVADHQMAETQAEIKSPPVVDAPLPEPQQPEPQQPDLAAEPPPPPPVVETLCDGVKLVIATDQLGRIPLMAQVDFNGRHFELPFTPGADPMTLCLKGLADTPGALLTLRILQKGNLRFIAKRANTVYATDKTTRVVIDNCLIQPVPWHGRSNDGSCEWTITEVDPG